MRWCCALGGAVGAGTRGGGGAETGGGGGEMGGDDGDENVRCPRDDRHSRRHSRHQQHVFQEWLRCPV